MRILLALFCIALAACRAPEPLERSSAHFRFLADTRTSSEPEMQAMVERGETLYAAVAEIIPPSFPLTETIQVQLNGDLTVQTPYVDETGTIQLYRYPDGEGGYAAVFAHEIVHAIGFDHARDIGALEWDALGFYNEAWAEYVAQVVDPGKTSFPFYGFDEDIVAGHWALESDLTMAALRDRHDALNGRCQVEAYPMRASWFRYVDETFGRAAALEVMYSGREMTPSVVEAALGVPLAEVDAGWRNWVIERFEAHPSAEAEVKAYRDRIGFYLPCKT